MLELKDCFVQLPFVRHILVFGSLARGQTDRWSDMDMILVTENRFQFKLAFDHLRHRALLQHDQHASGHFGDWCAVEIDELGRSETKRAELDAIFID